MSKKTTTTNNNQVYVSANEIFNSTELRDMAKIGLWNEQEIDDLFKVAHHKPQLNTLNKELKVALTTFYLCLPYESKIKRVYSEKIRRFKWENANKWNKELKIFDDGELQIKYLKLKAAKQKLLNDVSECKQNTLHELRVRCYFKRMRIIENCKHIKIVKIMKFTKIYTKSLSLNT